MTQVQKVHAVADPAAPELLDAPEAEQLFAEAIDAMQTARRGKVRVRVLAQLYRFGPGQRYKHWRGVQWRVDLDPTLTAAANFRASLAAFFEAVSTIGPGRVVEALQRAQGEKR
jgi:hypothetical protein